MEFEQILELINTVSATGLSSFTYEAEGVKIAMKGKQAPVVNVAAAPVAMAAPVAATVAENPIQTGDMAALTAAAQPATETQLSGKIVKSPLVGTFYVAPSEDADPYVRVGDTVKKGQTLAIVEAMKLMNEIESDYDGVVTEVLVQNGEPVEYGQPLFCIG